jgi:tRNA dimethylallyltransferase
VILGPTATGKSEVAVEVALRIGGEIVSGDSRAFFRGLDIATDKPSREARARVPHHLIDSVPIDGSYDAMAFRSDCDRLVRAIAGRRRVPIVAGGGTLYLSAILRGIFTGPSADLTLRARLSAKALPDLVASLAKVDPEAAGRIHPRDRMRLVRALEVYALSGHPISSLQKEARPLAHRFVVVGLRRERDDHRAAVAARVREMLDRGLLEEVARLRTAGLAKTAQAYRTIGVREAFAFLDGETTRSEMEEAIVRNTWSLVRRQTAWFRAEARVRWFDVTGRVPSDVAGDVVRHWEKTA